MTAARRRRADGRLGGDDEAILARLATRLERVDAELDRHRHPSVVRSAAPPLHVVRGRMQRAGSGIAPVLPAVAGSARRRHARVDLLTAGAAAVVLAAFALGRSIGDANPFIAPVGASASPTVSEPVASASVRPTPSSDGRPGVLPPLDPTSPPGGDAPGGDALAAELAGLRSAMAVVGWPCAIVVRVASDPIAPGLVAKLEAIGPLADGFLPGGLDPLWSGSDPDAAARAFKGRRVGAAPGGGLWLLRQGATGPGLLELSVQRTPAGSLLWRGGDAAWEVPCARASSDPKRLLAGHTGADWPDGQIVDIGVVSAIEPPAWAGRPG